MSYQKTTIARIIDEIDSNHIYLPAIQRKYVWTEDQITKLMDSILRGYPFGTFLFWKVKKRVVNEKQYSMYHFIKNYHERDRFRNEPVGTPFNTSVDDPDATILSALDGQQRLTSLYIALKGSISMKQPRKHWNSPDAFPQKELYFDLHSSPKKDEDIAFHFAFLTENESKDTTNGCLWYKVKNIVQYSKTEDVIMMMSNNGWINDTIALGNITALFASIKTNELVNYFEVESDKIDDVLDIFVRVNSGGTILSKTDLLFSTIVSYWDKAREEIDNLLAFINKIGDHYSFTNDFVMRTCLYVMDFDITLKVELFSKDNVDKIRKNWDGIEEAIKDTVNLLNELGFNEDNIVAYNAVLPIVYYRYKKGKEAFKDDSVKLELRKFLVISQIKHIFGQSTSSALNTIRSKVANQSDRFDLKSLQDLSFAGERDLKFTQDDIEEWFETYEKNAYTFMILSLLYPNLKYSQKGFHQDHMHPYSSFENGLDNLKLPNGQTMDGNKISVWKHQRNTLANLQLLEGRENESKNKTSLEVWLNDPINRENVKYLPQKIDYSLNNFDQFLEKRKELMLNELKKILL